MKCSCAVPDEDGNCLACGKHLRMPAPDIGDIKAICRLLEATTAAYGRLLELDADPSKPELPKLRLVGPQIVRVPRSAVGHDLLRPSFVAARRLGYRGTYERWGELVRDGPEPLPGGRSPLLK